MQRWGKQRQQQKGKIIQTIQQSLGAVKDVQVLGREQMFIDIHREQQMVDTGLLRRIGMIQALPRLWLEIVAMGSMASLVVVMLWVGKDVDEIVPVVGLFALSAFRVLPSVNKIVNGLQMLKVTRSTIETIHQDLGLAVSHSNIVDDGKFEFSLLSTSHLNFRYEMTDEDVLKDVNISVQRGEAVGFVGQSGSGKTTLVKQVLYNALLDAKQLPTEMKGGFSAIKGDLHLFDQIEMVDQNPIGKSSRSNPVTYIKAYDAIRDVYSKQALSKIRGFLPKHFSFNVDGGRCDTCKGEGEQLVEMQFLADVHLVCEDCGGKRFKEAVLEVQYKGKSIHDVLEMSVDEAIAFFSEEKNIVFAISPLQEVGLGYVKLGQSSSTLSGGEAQRVKLASFLGKGKASNKMLFIFDEPTTGLHFHDIHKLLKAFNALIEQGHSLIVVEHNTDVIKVADWVIDMGPEAGVDGGTVVYAGIPKGLSKCKASKTGKYLD